MPIKAYSVHKTTKIMPLWHSRHKSISQQLKKIHIILTCSCPIAYAHLTKHLCISVDASVCIRRSNCVYSLKQQRLAAYLKKHLIIHILIFLKKDGGKKIVHLKIKIYQKGCVKNAKKMHRRCLVL